VGVDATEHQPHCAWYGGLVMILHFLGVLLFLYVVALLVFPQHVLGITIVMVAWVANLVDWTTVPWTP
tara:strand:- start:1574 stop:1777 length:204 start_codon:yes stop_codon:yes gene_type:complete